MRSLWLLMSACLLLPVDAFAHGFGALYNLPVPLWLYNWAASSALLLSFIIAAVVLSGPVQMSVERHAAVDIDATIWARGLHWLAPAFRVVAVFLLLLCVATGFIGNPDPTRNFSMTFFWVIFLLLFTYLTALWGNLYAALNPWQAVANGLAKVWRGYGRGRLSYPRWLGDWPALVFYLGFIWFELFGRGTPKSLASFLLGYTGVNLVGVWLVGRRDWFRHCEFFSLFLRLMALMAPLYYKRDEPDRRGRLYIRRPFAGLLDARPEHLSSVVFALAMLSTTAFDGLKATQWWVQLFWSDPSGFFNAHFGVPPVQALAAMRPWFIAWESFWLFVSPFIYLGAYMLAIWLARGLSGSSRSVRELALDFGFTLLPIAIVYHITHYATLILNHGLKIISHASDPFGWRWDLFGTAMKFRAPILPDMSVVWHSQVGLILFGHIVSVWVAHLVALRVFRSRCAATLSQLPMLALTIGLTVSGLWIIAQPLTVMLMR